MTAGRLRGNQGLILTLKVGAGAVTDVAATVKEWELIPEDGEDSDLTFEEAMAGEGAQWTLKGKAIVSFEAGSLWQYQWANAGADALYVLGPAGNAVPSATKPHFTGTLSIGKKPGLGNQARTSKEGAEYEFEFKGVDEPTKVTTA